MYQRPAATTREQWASTPQCRHSYNSPAEEPEFSTFHGSHPTQKFSTSLELEVSQPSTCNIIRSCTRTTLGIHSETFSTLHEPLSEQSAECSTKTYSTLYRECTRPYTM